MTEKRRGPITESGVSPRVRVLGYERNKQRIPKKESQGSGDKLGQCGVWKPSEESVPKGRK